MRVAQLMSNSLWSCRIDDTLEYAAQLLWEHDCGSLPVVGSHDQLHGMLTDRDICMAAYTTGQPLALLQVREAMAIDVASVRLQTTLAEAEELMRHYRVHRLPVVDEHECVVGLISSNDLLRWADVRRRQGIDTAAVHLVATLATIGTPRRPAPASSASDHAATALPAASAS